MSQIAANNPAPAETGLSDAAWERRLEQIASDPRMNEDNIHANGVAGKFAMPLFLLGGLGLLGTVIGVFSFTGKHALAAFEVGVFTALGMSLGALFFLLVFNSLNAGWIITGRRIFEHVASLLPFCWLLLAIVVVIELLNGGVLMTWMGEETYLLKKKAPYLNTGFFLVRFVLYGLVWFGLSRMIVGYSKKADETGDRTLSRKARYNSGWGILAFALTTAFCAFDFLMSLDYRFFSTMWGVYYFASCALGAVSVVVLTLAVLRSRGKLVGLVTDEHFHDLGKLMFAFTVFWAYIAFSQYFLIWYSNIPEETAWYVYRKGEGYHWLFILLCAGHFVVPFLALVWRGNKRNTLVAGVLASFLIVMTIFDMVWIIRPMAYLNTAPDVADPGLAGIWLDAAGVIGVLGIWGGLLASRLEKGPLLPIKDPMLHESMSHKNYV